MSRGRLTKHRNMNADNRTTRPCLIWHVKTWCIITGLSAKRLTHYSTSWNGSRYSARLSQGHNNPEHGDGGGPNQSVSRTRIMICWRFFDKVTHVFLASISCTNSDYLGVWTASAPTQACLPRFCPAPFQVPLSGCVRVRM